MIKNQLIFPADDRVILNWRMFRILTSTWQAFLQYVYMQMMVKEGKSPFNAATDAIKLVSFLCFTYNLSNKI